MGGYAAVGSIVLVTGVHIGVPVVQLVVLAALAFAASRIQALEFRLRGVSTPAGVVIVVAALLGGPVAGAIVGRLVLTATRDHGRRISWSRVGGDPNAAR